MRTTAPPCLLTVMCAAINKPRGMSSAQVIRETQLAFNPSPIFRPLIDAELRKLKQSGQKVRNKLVKRANQVKIGHGGTLDPLATGVLILGIGSATKALPQFLDCVKTYDATILFGASTDTYDRAGRVLTRRPYDHITREKVEAALEGFRGKQNQIPPLYSALKMDGKPLYEYAREGKPIPREISSREVEVKEIELLEWYEPGTHPHRWPAEEAEAAERNLAEQVWRVKKQQETGRKLTPEEQHEDDQAIAAHEAFKRKFEERQDDLIREAPSKKRRHSKEPPMMSGALGNLPQTVYSKKGLDLVPDAPDESTPPPWKDQGPPACKVRMTVTSGYYVRSFCHDLGARLESAGLMAELDRVRQSDFTVGGVNCLEYSDLAKGEEVWGPKVVKMLARWNGEPTDDDQPPSAPPSKFKSPPPPKEKINVKDRIAAEAQEILRRADAQQQEQQQQEDPQTYHRPIQTENQSEKRRRSPSPVGGRGSPPHKTRALSPNRRSQGRDSDEESWNGIQD
ncbi:tRNA pseudouridine synthase-like protein [Hapsidospora chrysogenum ATCC 11550]|uniref:tRNA pseudouridine(55) synthase n=1 Tax=Hapsidospora chrysogenum (strain ATCC 11550 / CBS 779.69 / DSM 880 / IAM 14645 / JCM 23072 / IMI 49137) TaxID=857340 RepID=A0A086TBC3_HAPC1|nr:tRNA pseudouridine synthase-like protein [Hapsidospora chrysogenum ATCC 11550]